MRITGEHSFPVPQERLWQALLDPEVLAGTLPGCETLTRSGDNELSGRLKIKVGPVQGVFEGKVKLDDLDPPNGYRMRIDGQGAAGFMKGDGTIRLVRVDDLTTMLHYDLEAQVGGRIAGVGQRLLESSAKVITRQTLEGLERQLAPTAVTTTAVTTTAVTSTAVPPTAVTVQSGATAPAALAQAAVAGDPVAETPPLARPDTLSQTAFAGAFLKGLVAELVPRERRMLLLGALALIALIAVAVFFRACA